jgi:methyl-accepting chemotaxis protein/methyl-accepting chemotaxis protein-1 (serine sensor receptor)
MIVACAAVGGAGWWSLQALATRLDQSVSVTTRNIELAAELRADVLTFRMQERGMLLFSFIHANEQVLSCRDNYNKAMNAAFEKIAAIRALSHTDRGTELMNQAEAGVQEYKARQLEVWQILETHKVPEATEYDKKTLVATGGRIIAALDQFGELMHGLNGEVNDEALHVKATAKTVLALGLLGCALLGVLAILAMRRAIRTLQLTTGELQQGADEVAAAAGQVAMSSQELAQGCSQQAEWLQETAASSETISSIARNNSDKSVAAADLVNQSGRRFTEANLLLEQTVMAMTDLNQQSGKISSVVKVIDGIAFQTNILALNAAVEAARAGEAGMGFAVVADEVRNLAQRCAQGAKDTSELIEQSVSKSVETKAMVDQVALAIHGIIEQAAQVKALVDEVNAGGQEQARGAEQVGQSVAKIGKVTQQTAASAEESAAAAEELTAQSQTFKSLLDRLTTLAGASRLQIARR